ncbi:hypothetical protein BST81_04195 [Leptolyngbya sp. 'hensonii']|uniref:phospholipase D-like domain-containing protein n=1 Tax=Leptolyngbya sp. 'hensonii' TaxID=1922337 RepID=UPI0009501B15|nr:phospholipase D-like domain-containing protein [Leptolyngbya sp. 'hensonii']OLP19741.1 hypothetical protein BST81_04195 [Leptolyngbya sp. 'hensonii']
MSDLSSTEKTKLEVIFEMKKGYVLNFSDRTFKDFILDNTGINVEEKYKDIEEKYNLPSSSKSNRLRAFWKEESNQIVGKLISALLEHWRTQKLIKFLDIKNSEKALFDECLLISQRLINDGREDEVSVDAHFKQIQEKIIEQINSAEFTIWIAVAWFTDRVLFDELLIKSDQGINIQLIINDDEINKDSGLNYEDEFETYRIRKLGKYKKNTMHHKFCVIDLKTVIHGSYNWTNNAKFNREDIAVQSGRENAEVFAREFIKLKNIALSQAQE